MPFSPEIVEKIPTGWPWHFDTSGRHNSEAELITGCKKNGASRKDVRYL
jgi:hypothetical protein